MPAFFFSNSFVFWERTVEAMATEQKKSALVRLGYFGEGTYITIGEPYDTKRAGLELCCVPPISACPALKATRAHSPCLV